MLLNTDSKAIENAIKDCDLKVNPFFNEIAKTHGRLRKSHPNSTKPGKGSTAVGSFGR